MEWKTIKNYIAIWITRLFFVLFVIAIVFGGIKYCCKDNEPTTPPVERIEIDSITRVNDKLIIEVEHLDSIKDAKVIEVKSLDNDSTLKLFYKLIGK